MKLKKSVGIPILILSAGLYTAYILFTILLQPGEDLGIIHYFWHVNYVLNILGMFMLVFVPSKRLPLPKGKVLAVVPAFNEDPAMLRTTIQSLLEQTRPADLVVVVDDGSATPVEAYPDSRVRLMRLKKNGGKREAQAAVLKGLDHEEYPYVLTVDSDSQLMPTALEEMLRQMSNPKVKACCATILVKNYAKNVLTEVQELNFGISCMIARSARRAFGVLETVSGACSLFRSDLLVFHLSDYLADGDTYPCGDDRRLTIYALMEGDVLFVPEAVAYTQCPEKLSVLWRQRVRWARSMWTSIPYYIINVPPKGCIFPFLNFFLSILNPLALTAILISPLKAKPVFLLEFFGFIFLQCYTQTLFHVAARPGWSMADRISRWTYVPVLLALFFVFMSTPAEYVALWQVLSNKIEWGTRDNPKDVPKESGAPASGRSVTGVLHAEGR